MEHLLDEDFTTFEGRSANEMVESEIAHAQKQRMDGDLQGAIVRLERAGAYGQAGAASLVEQAAKEPDPVRKDGLLKAAGKLDGTVQLLERMLKEFKG